MKAPDYICGTLEVVDALGTTKCGDPDDPSLLIYTRAERVEPLEKEVSRLQEIIHDVRDILSQHVPSSVPASLKRLNEVVDGSTL